MLFNLDQSVIFYLFLEFLFLQRLAHQLLVVHLLLVQNPRILPFQFVLVFLVDRVDYQLSSFALISLFDLLGLFLVVRAVNSHIKISLSKVFLFLDLCLLR